MPYKIIIYCQTTVQIFRYLYRLEKWIKEGNYRDE